MSQVSQLSPELVRGFLRVAPGVARRDALLDALPPEYPAVGVSAERLCDAIRESSLGSAFDIGITPDTLIIGGVAPNQVDDAIAVLDAVDPESVTLDPLKYL